MHAYADVVEVSKIWGRQGERKFNDQGFPRILHVDNLFPAQDGIRGPDVGRTAGA